MKQALVILMAIMFLVGITVSTGWTQSGSNVKSFTKQKNRKDKSTIEEVLTELLRTNRGNKKQQDLKKQRDLKKPGVRTPQRHNK